MYAHLMPKVAATVMAFIALGMVDSFDGPEAATALALPFSAAVAYLILGSANN